MSEIKVQSFSDIITNSSSEIYMCLSYNGVELFKDIINSVLKIAGSNKECDDYFDIDEWGESIRVKAKNPDCEEAAYILSKVNDIFYLQTKR